MPGYVTAVLGVCYFLRQTFSPGGEQFSFVIFENWPLANSTYFLILDSLSKPLFFKDVLNKDYNYS